MLISKFNLRVIFIVSSKTNKKAEIENSKKKYLIKNDKDMIYLILFCYCFRVIPILIMKNSFKVDTIMYVY